MEILILFLIVLVVIVVIAKLISARQSSTPERAANTPPVYNYGRKDYLMTQSENEFFQFLKELVQDNYQVFPQVHLTALLDEKKVTGQNWGAAFRHINGKSVDFVVCDLAYARPLIAIELDDISHDADDRHSRDVEVERIFESAHLPLVRFRDYKTIGREAVAAQIKSALAKTAASSGGSPTH